MKCWTTFRPPNKVQLACADSAERVLLSHDTLNISSAPEKLLLPLQANFGSSTLAVELIEPSVKTHQVSHCPTAATFSTNKKHRQRRKTKISYVFPFAMLSVLLFSITCLYWLTYYHVRNSKQQSKFLDSSQHQFESNEFQPYLLIQQSLANAASFTRHKRLSVQRLETLNNTKSSSLFLNNGSSSSSSSHSTSFYRPFLPAHLGTYDSNEAQKNFSFDFKIMSNVDSVNTLANDSNFVASSPLAFLLAMFVKTFSNDVNASAVAPFFDQNSSVSKQFIGKEKRISLKPSRRTEQQQINALVFAPPHMTSHLNSTNEQTEEKTSNVGNYRVRQQKRELFALQDDDAKKQKTGESNNNKANSLLLLSPVIFRRSNRTMTEERIRRLPQALIIGVRKGGTRAVLEFLAAHPSVRAASKEMHYFNRDENFAKGIDWYRSKMPPTTENEITIEKTPAYFVTAEAPERVLQSLNSTALKLIIVLRDPVQRTISDYVQWAVTKQQQQLQKSKRRKRSVAYPPIEQMVIGRDGQVNASYTPVGFSTYDVHIARWLEHFPLKQMHFVDGDRFVHEPHAELEQLESFLNIDTFFKPDMFYFNSTKGFFCVKQPEDYFLTSESNFTAKPTFTAKSRFKSCLGDTKGRKHPQVNKGVIARLRQFFKPHNEKFFKFVGRRFENW